MIIATEKVIPEERAYKQGYNNAIQRACDWIEHNYMTVLSEEERGGIMFWKQRFKEAMEG